MRTMVLYFTASLYALGFQAQQGVAPAAKVVQTAPNVTELQAVIKDQESRIHWLEAKVAELQKLNKGMLEFFQAQLTLTQLERTAPPVTATPAKDDKK